MELPQELISEINEKKYRSPKAFPLLIEILQRDNPTPCLPEGLTREQWHQKFQNKEVVACVQIFIQLIRDMARDNIARNDQGNSINDFREYFDKELWAECRKVSMDITNACRSARGQMSYEQEQDFVRTMSGMSSTGGIAPPMAEIDF